MGRMADLSPLYDDLTFLSPLSEARANSLVAFVAEGEPSTVLDIGCGWGELLMRILTSVPQAHGLGVDIEPRRIEEAGRRAAARGLADRARFEARDARLIKRTRDAVVCIGASQVWGPPVEARQPLDYAAALTALRDLVPTGGRLVYGEAIWDTAPTPAATSALSGRDDEYLSVEELTALVQGHGFTVSHVDVASQDEWDRFETGFAHRLERWLDRHPSDHPEGAEVRKQLDEQRTRYLKGYRGVLGMAYINLIAR